MKADALTYALVTPARNEAAFIRNTISCVIAQTIRPVRWVIVSDGSNDGTDEIASQAARDQEWIEFIRMPERRERNFAGKVGSFNAGYERLRGLRFDIIGSLDADITFEPDYFAFLLQRFSLNPQLGVGGTPFNENGSVYDYRFSNIEHVSGACQLFRRECFDEIGGYVPVKGGGIDLIAVLTARMKGWHTRSFPEKTSVHHRPMGSANNRNAGVASFKLGIRGYCLGFHPLWQVFRSLYQMSKRPYVIGGAALFMGYFWAMLCRFEKPISRELVEFQQQEQMRRLRKFFHLGIRDVSAAK
jgi:biofilm PGA synthesis N-glycosyltransferase PgaC